MTMNEAIRPGMDSMTPVPYRVMGVKQETSDTFTLSLEPANGQSLQPFLPGQFNMLYVFGIGEVPISISGDPGDPDIFIHTTRKVGTVTGSMKKLAKGDCVGVRGPFGTHWPVRESQGQDMVIVAGGIGLAPLRPALYQILAERNRFGRVVLLYGARTPEDILFQSELKRWRSQFDLEVHVTVDRSTKEWRGNIGVVPDLIAKAPFDPHETVALVCGPEVMMRFAIKALAKRGVGLESVFLSMERNMKCAIGICGHCQYGPTFICKDGPVFRYDQVAHLLDRWEL